MTTRDLYAEALASVNKMRDDLTAAHETIGQLRADLVRAEDRCTMLDEERRRARAEALVFRSKLVTLATIQGNINLLSAEGATILKVVHDLTERAETPDDETLAKIEADLALALDEARGASTQAAGTQANGRTATLETLPQGAPPNA